MNGKKISKRHKRLLSSLFFVLEQKIESIEHMINHTQKNATYEIQQDLEDHQLQALKIECATLKARIAKASIKLDLKNRKISQSQYIATMQSQMWENISDAFSDKLKGYGKEVVEGGKQADHLVQQIADQIDKLKL